MEKIQKTAFLEGLPAGVGMVAFAGVRTEDAAQVAVTEEAGYGIA